MVVDTRVHGLVNAFGWVATRGGVSGDKRIYPLPGWHVNTSGEAVSVTSSADSGAAPICSVICCVVLFAIVRCRTRLVRAGGLLWLQPMATLWLRTT